MSVMLSVPLRNPNVAGVKVTLIVQVAFTARVAGRTPQGLDGIAKLPVIAMAVMVRGAPPLLVRVTSEGELVVPTGKLPKSPPPLTVASGAFPEPLKLTV